MPHTDRTPTDPPAETTRRTKSRVRRRTRIAAAVLLLSVTAPAMAPAPSTVVGTTPAVSSLPNSSLSAAPAPCLVELPSIDDKCEEWASTYDSPGADASAPTGGIAQNPSSGWVYQVGTTYQHSCTFGPAYTCGDIVTVAYDADGNQMWDTQYVGPDGNDDVGRDVAVSTDGTRVYVTGTRDGMSNDAVGDLVILAYDATTGDPVWEASYTNPNTSANVSAASGWSIALSPDDREVYVTGYTRTASDYDYLTVAAASDTGRLLWDAAYDSPLSYPTPDFGFPDLDRGLGVVASPDGKRIYVTGASAGNILSNPGPDGAPHLDFVTIAYSTEGTAAGTELWVARFDNIGLRDDPAGKLQLSPDGSKLFVTGKSATADWSASYGWSTVAYDTASGAELWRHIYQRGFDRESSAGQALAVSPDGNRLYVTGHISSFDTMSATSAQTSRWATTSYDAQTGDVLWTTDYRDPLNPGGHSTAVPEAIAVSRDGNSIFVSGDSPARLSAFPGATSQSTATTIAYDSSSGLQQWIARYDISSTMTNGPSFSPLYLGGSRVISSHDGSRLYVSLMLKEKAAGVGSASSFAVAAYSTTP